MTDYQIHADYDHSRRISGHPNEYALRHTRPGAILLANLDADSRRNPGFQSNGGAVILDWQRTAKRSGENDLLRFEIRIVHRSLPDDCQLYLRTIGWLSDRFRIYDSRGLQLRHLPTMPNVYPIARTSTPLAFQLEAHTPPGSPLYMPSTLGLASTPPGQIHEGVIKLQLYYFDADDQFTLLDWGYFTVAPMMFIDNTCDAEAMYICEIRDATISGNATKPDNHPTIADVEAIRTRIGVSLVKVPPEVCLGDAWLQDQFKIGYCHGPSGWMHVILHLPRMRSNSIHHSVVDSNLAHFARTYFPSNGIGVFQELWERRVRFQEANGNVRYLAFRDSQEIVLMVGRVFDFRMRLYRTLAWLTREERGTDLSVTIGEALIELPSLLERVVRQIGISDRNLSQEDRDSLVRELREIHHDIRSSITVQGDRISLRTTSLQGDLTDQELMRLYERLDQMNGGGNYGGNIHVSPPFREASFGKLVIGNTQAYDRDLVDPDLRRFLQRQYLQPVVEIDTSWLQVGHIDELLTLVPSNQSGQGFAIVRASPAVARYILYEAFRLHLQGLHPDLRPMLSHSDVREFVHTYLPSRRLTVRGAAPVTRMLRGKQWLHRFRPDDIFPLEPPSLYRSMVWRSREYLAVWGRDIRDQDFPSSLPYRPGQMEDRSYPADISIFEFLHYEDGTNSEIEALETDVISQDESGEDLHSYMELMDEVLAQEFPGVPVLKLPVLFDNFLPTVAFTPNLVNMQVINGHAILPRPFGPRMAIQDAISVLSAVFESISAPQHVGRLNERYFRDRALLGTTLWRRFGHIRDISEQFRDGFPNMSLAGIEDLLREANSRTSPFLPDGRLRPDWHEIIIPEETVDLFEAYSQIILESIGLRVHWVDTWFYHVRLGEIHCGTSVRRRPRITGQRSWWQNQGATT